MDKDVTHKGEDNEQVCDDPMEGELNTYDIEQPHAPVPSDEKPRRRRWCTEAFWIRTIVIFGHCSFFGVAVLANFIYDWSNDSEGAAWLALTNEGVTQHLKTILWPWLLILLPMDLLSQMYCARNGLETEQCTFYLRCIARSSWLTLCLSTMVAMLSGMLFIAIVFSILLYGGSELLAVDVTVYTVGVIAATLLRLFLMKRKTVVMWAAFIYLLGGTIWFFTYFSYSENVYEGYWFDPDPYNRTSEDEN
jgi:hypothetical protein